MLNRRRLSNIETLSLDGSGIKSLETIREEAASLLSQRRQEIERLNTEIEKVEKEVSRVRANLEIAINNMNLQESKENNDSDEEEYTFEHPEVEELREKHKNEIKKVQDEHQGEIDNLREEFCRKIKVAENWSIHHQETLKLEKQNLIEELKFQIECLKTNPSGGFTYLDQKRSNFVYQTQQIALKNANRIDELERKIADVVSLTKEEVRAARFKIDECVRSAELRQREHELENQKYETEIKERKDKYDEHLASLSQQYMNERTGFSLQVSAAETKLNGLERVLSGLDKHHKKQLQTHISDIERLKASLYSTKIRNDQSMNITSVNSMILTNTNMEYRYIENEMRETKEEIDSMRKENKIIKEEIETLKKSIRELKVVVTYL